MYVAMIISGKSDMLLEMWVFRGPVKGWPACDRNGILMSPSNIVFDEMLGRKIANSFVNDIILLVCKIGLP